MLDDSGKQKIYSFHEVYYEAGDTPTEFTKMPETMMSEDLQELVFKAKAFLMAVEEPILSINNFPQEVHDHEDL
jgi:hypothetical protein